ncbi:MAG: sugar ABC transporter permease [Erysipelotrichaceae bacterium]|nr:sugar ABC transporter permease [Erysipelotrichaceae bacterium]
MSEKKHMGIKAKTRLSNTIIYIILTVMSIVWLFPFFCIVCESFRVESTHQVGYVIPKQWGLDNYINLFTKTDFPVWFKNTFLIALFVAVIQTVIVLCMSYTLSRLRFKSRKGLMNVMLILGMFPGFLSMIVLYKVLNGMGLTGPNSIPGLILVYVGSSGMGYYVSKGYFDTIPRSLDEAARVDGANRLQVLTKVMLPLCKPIVIYTILTAFMGPWGDFMFAKYIAHASSAGMTVAVGLQSMIGTPSALTANYTMFCAGGVVVAVPITILFMSLQKYYVEGVTGGAVKG